MMFEKEVKRFTYHLYTLLESGIELKEALRNDLTEYLTENKEFKDILHTIREDMEKEVSFLDAISKFPYCFPPYYIGMIHLTVEYPDKIKLKYVLKGLIQYDLI